MGVLSILKKIIRLLKAKFGTINLSLPAKLFLTLILSLLLKEAFGGTKDTNKFQIMPISEFFSPMNKSVLEEVHVYPNELIAKDAFQNLIKTRHAGLPSRVLYEELKYFYFYQET